MLPGCREGRAESAQLGEGTYKQTHSWLMEQVSGSSFSRLWASKERCKISGCPGLRGLSLPVQRKRSTRRRGVQAMVHTAPEPTVGLGCPGLLFSPPSARGGAVHANVCQSRGCPAPPSALGLELNSHPRQRRMGVGFIPGESPKGSTC